MSSDKASAGIDLGYKPDPDWRRLAAALTRQGDPDRVPLFELTIGFSAMEQILGRPRPHGSEAESLEEFVRFRTDFYYRAGYDFVAVGPLVHFPKNPRNAPLGIIHDRASSERYPWPEIRDEHLRYVELTEAVLPCGMKVRPRGAGGVLANLVGIMGFEGLSYALADDPELVRWIVDAIGERLVDLYTRYAQYESVEFIAHGDDMGFKTATMISPRDLREYIFPWHRRIAEAIHAGGKIAVLHSDGNLEEIMEDVIACGWDAKHSVEDEIMPAVEMKRRWGDRIAICGAFDVDRLTRSTPDQVREHARTLIEQCGPGGGWAFGTGNAVTDYVPIENYIAMLQAAREFG